MRDQLGYAPLKRLRHQSPYFSGFSFYERCSIAQTMLPKTGAGRDLRIRSEQAASIRERRRCDCPHLRQAQLAENFA